MFKHSNLSRYEIHLKEPIAVFFVSNKNNNYDKYIIKPVVITKDFIEKSVYQPDSDTAFYYFSLITDMFLLETRSFIHFENDYHSKERKIY